jgi:hypothetical protein
MCMPRPNHLGGDLFGQHHIGSQAGELCLVGVERGPGATQD